MRAILWDYDGTLGYRQGGMWSASLLEAIRADDPSSPLTLDEVRARLRGIFPWERPAEPHPQLCAPAAWWAAQVALLEGALGGLGFQPARARRVAAQVPAIYLNPAAWHLYPDTLPTLDLLSARGWRHYVLSNHLPELRDIVARLGLAPRLSGLFNSAETGYEKPHPQAFRLAREAIGPARPIWMVGDNPIADVAGAEAAGLPAILVRTPPCGTRYHCADLAGVPAILAGAPSR